MFEKMFEGGVGKSRAPAPPHEDVARTAGAEFLDVGRVAATDGGDGVRFAEAGQKAMGLAGAEKAKAIPRQTDTRRARP